MADTEVVNLPIPPAPVAAEEPAAVAEEKEPVAAASADAEPVRDPNRVYTQDEMDKIAAKIKKNERYRTKKEIEAYYQGRESIGQTAQPVVAAKAEETAAEAKPPTRDQFGTYEEFLEAKAIFAGERASERAYQKREADAKAAAEAKTAEERGNSFKTKLLEKYPDIGERAADIAHVVIPAHLVEALQDSAVGPEMFDHFVGNPKELERIMALSTSAANREIGKLEARLEGAATQSTQPVTAASAPQTSRAPTPIRPVGGTAVNADSEPSHDQPDKWRAWRDRQVQKRKATGTK